MNEQTNEHMNEQTEKLTQVKLHDRSCENGRSKKEFELDSQPHFRWNFIKKFICNIKTMAKFNY